MERLVQRKNGGLLVKSPQLAYEKLAHYEDLEEQGLLTKLPCKVGDTVYIFQNILSSTLNKEIIRCQIDEFSICDGTNTYAVLNGCEPFYAMRRFKAVPLSEFGKTVFLTKEEAEQKLAEMNEVK